MRHFIISKARVKETGNEAFYLMEGSTFSSLEDLVDSLVSDTGDQLNIQTPCYIPSPATDVTLLRWGYLFTLKL